MAGRRDLLGMLGTGLHKSTQEDPHFPKMGLQPQTQITHDEMRAQLLCNCRRPWEAREGGLRIHANSRKFTLVHARPCFRGLGALIFTHFHAISRYLTPAGFQPHLRKHSNQEETSRPRKQSCENPEPTLHLGARNTQHCLVWHLAHSAYNRRST